MVSIVYVLMFIFTCSGLYLSGRLIESSSRSNYWQYALVGILAYSLNVGLRFGRGVDYNLYYYVYHSIIDGVDGRFEPLFVLLVRFFGLVQLDWPSFVFFMSFLFVFSIYFMLKDLPDLVKFSLPMAFFLSPWVENIMRQTMGFSVMMIAIGFLIRRERSYLKFFLFSFIALLFHSSVIVFVPISLLFYKFDIVVKPLYSIPLYIAAILLAKTGIVDEVFDLMFILGGSLSSFEHLDYDRFSEGGASQDNSLSATLSLLYVLLLYYGYQTIMILKRNVTLFLAGHQIEAAKKELFLYKCTTFFFNLALIGIFTYPLFLNNELLYRFTKMFSFFSFLVFGVVCYVYGSRSEGSILLSRQNLFKIPVVFILFLLLQLNLVRTLVTPCFRSPYCYQYVWNSGGKHVLDITMFKMSIKKGK